MGSSEGRLHGRVALVTGAAGGIGRAVVAALAEAGATVAASDLEAPQNIEGAALTLALDVTREADWRAAIDEVTGRLGRLDILVNNAGLAITRPLEETTLEDWRAVMAVNLEGTFLGVKHAIGAMKDREAAADDDEAAAIVNISSLAGIVGAPMLAAYSAAKGGVRLFTKSAALYCTDRGYPIRINSVHPGFVDTVMLDGIAANWGAQGSGGPSIKGKIAKSTPLGRLARPSEIAEAVVFLAGPQSSYMTGAELVLDGGYSAA